MSEFVEVQRLNYRRQFLTPEGDRYDDSTLYSTVALTRWDDDPAGELDIDAELRISNGYGIAEFNSTRIDDEDEYFAMITALTEGVIAFRQAYADALAIKRGQSVSVGAAAALEMTVDASPDHPAPGSRVIVESARLVPPDETDKPR